MKNGFEFVLSKIENIDLGNVKIEIKQYEAYKDISYRTKSNIRIINSMDKEIIIESIDYDAIPFMFKINNKEYIFIRRDLYGYTFIDTNTYEEINYFPDIVLKGREAFIINSVQSFDDLLVLEGCYWAGPSELYIMDFNTRALIRIADYCDITELLDESVKIINNLLVFSNEENGKEYQFTYDRLINLINTDGRYDL